MNLVYIILAVLVAVVSIAVRKASRQREGYTSDRVFERTPQMPYKVNPTVLRTNLNKLGNRVFELQGLLSTGTSSVSLRRNWEIEYRPTKA